MATYSIRQYAWAAATIVAALASASYLDNHVANHLVWGGNVCETNAGIYTCVGYPPTGLMLLFLLSAAVVMFVSGLSVGETSETYPK